MTLKPYIIACCALFRTHFGDPQGSIFSYDFHAIYLVDNLHLVSRYVLVERIIGRSSLKGKCLSTTWTLKYKMARAYQAVLKQCLTKLDRNKCLE